MELGGAQCGSKLHGAPDSEGSSDESHDERHDAAPGGDASSQLAARRRRSARLRCSARQIPSWIACVFCPPDRRCEQPAAYLVLMAIGRSPFLHTDVVKEGSKRPESSRRAMYVVVVVAMLGSSVSIGTIAAMELGLTSNSPALQ